MTLYTVWSKVPTLVWSTKIVILGTAYLLPILQNRFPEIIKLEISILNKLFKETIAMLVMQFSGQGNLQQKELLTSSFHQQRNPNFREF